MVTADAAVFAFVESEVRLLLVQRKRPPYQGQWALPGGFIEMDEDLKDAAARELAEETSLKGVRLVQFGTFGTPGRDPRGRVISVAYTGIAEAGWENVRAADDAAAVKWHDIDNLPALAFDHDKVAHSAIEYMKQTEAYRDYTGRRAT